MHSRLKSTLKQLHNANKDQHTSIPSHIYDHVATQCTSIQPMMPENETKQDGLKSMTTSQPTDQTSSYAMDQ